MSCWDTDFRLTLFVSLRIEDYNSYQGWAQFKIIRVITNYGVYIRVYTHVYIYIYNFVKWTIALSDDG